MWIAESPQEISLPDQRESRVEVESFYIKISVLTTEKDLTLKRVEKGCTNSATLSLCIDKTACYVSLRVSY